MKRLLLVWMMILCLLPVGVWAEENADALYPIRDAASSGCNIWCITGPEKLCIQICCHPSCTATAVECIDDNDLHINISFSLRHCMP